jgi:hypothetical protein
MAVSYWRTAMSNWVGEAYWEGFNCGMNGDPWTHVQSKHHYKAGTESFHKYLEGWSDGCKALYLAAKKAKQARERMYESPADRMAREAMEANQAADAAADLRAQGAAA